MTNAQARARVWTRCLCVLILCALTGPLVGLLAPLARASAPTLNVVAAVLAAALVGASWPSPSCPSSPSYASCGPTRPTIDRPAGKR